MLVKVRYNYPYTFDLWYSNLPELSILNVFYKDVHMYWKYYMFNKNTRMRTY